MGIIKVDELTGITGDGGPSSPITFSGDTISKFNAPAGMIIGVENTTTTTIVAGQSSFFIYHAQRTIQASKPASQGA